MNEMGSVSTTSVLVFGFVLGLKHAVEADHLAAVSSIVSERKSLLGSTLVGGLWGLGHTVSLLAAGVAVIVFHVEIGERAALALEFVVGLMLIALGADALRKLARGGHVHTSTSTGTAGASTRTRTSTTPRRTETRTRTTASRSARAP
jgi:hypothetical protein